LPSLLESADFDALVALLSKKAFPIPI